MSKKEITNFATQSLIIFLMTTFVISAVFPDYTLDLASINIEEVDLDEKESSEEKKENKENKENIHQVFSNAADNRFGEDKTSKHADHIFVLQELYLPVITPPPDHSNGPC